MRILFILAIFIFLYSLLRIKKSKQKQNILLWIALAIIIIMAFNTLMVFFLSIFDVAATLLIRSIIFLVISFIILIFSRKDKQKYYFSYQDVCMILFILILGFLIFVLKFGFGFDLYFEMNDAIYHFNNAQVFYDISTIVEDATEPTMMYDVYKIKSLVFGYTNLGTLFQLADVIVGEYDLYKLFILFEMFSFVMGGILFYFLVRKEAVSKKKYLLSIVLITFYMLGYPLCNLLMGYHYWHLSLLQGMTIILLVKELFNLDKNKYFVILLLSCLALSLFLTYYLFVPLIYFIVGLYILSKYKIYKEISLKRSIIYIIIILVIPFIIGMIHYFICPYFETGYNAAGDMNIDGTNYCSLIGNFIFILPLIIYLVIEEIKKKKYTIELIGLLSTLLYNIIFFILVLCDKMSVYYYHKIYLYTWLFTYIYLFKCLYECKISLAKIYLYSYMIIVFLGIINIEEIVNDKVGKISNNYAITYLTDIYQFNINYMKDDDPVISNYDAELIDYVMDHYDEYKNVRGEIPFIGRYFSKMWITQIYNIYVSNNFSSRNEYYVNNIENIERDKETRYIVWIYDKNNIDLIDMNKYKIVYKNSAGCVLEKNEDV